MRLYLTWTEFELITQVVIDTDYTGSYKSKDHMITKTMARLAEFSDRPFNKKRYQVPTKIGLGYLLILKC